MCSRLINIKHRYCYRKPCPSAAFKGTPADETDPAIITTTARDILFAKLKGTGTVAAFNQLLKITSNSDYRLVHKRALAAAIFYTISAGSVTIGDIIAALPDVNGMRMGHDINKWIEKLKIIQTGD